MKTFSETQKRKNKKPPSPKACVLANALILPGLGTLMRHRREGYFQVATAVAGLVVSAVASARLLQIMGNIPIAPIDPDVAVRLVHDAAPELISAAAGLVVFGFSWLWSMSSSAAIFRDDRNAQPPMG